MKILIIGPLPPPVYGVSLSNQVLRKGLTNKEHLVYSINTSSSKRIDAKIGSLNILKLGFAFNYFSLYKIMFVDLVYITTGQTFFGIIKYAPFVFISKLLGKKVIVHVKGGYLKRAYSEMPLLKQKIVRIILSNYSSGIVLSKSLVQLLEPFLPKERIFIQHNFIQKTLINDEHESILHKKRHERLNVIFLSNLMREKGIYELLEALKSLEDMKIPYEARIAGNIPIQEKGILEKIENLKNTSYLGVVNGKEKKDLLVWGNVFCLPTYYKMEGQPISIIEAMGFGNLILTTRHAGIPDICSEDSTFFVEKRNQKDILEKLIHANNNLTNVLTIGRYNLNFANELYSEEKFIDGMIKIFES